MTQQTLADLGPHGFSAVNATSHSTECMPSKVFLLLCDSVASLVLCDSVASLLLCDSVTSHAPRLLENRIYTPLPAPGPQNNSLSLVVVVYVS